MDVKKFMIVFPAWITCIVVWSAQSVIGQETGFQSIIETLRAYATVATIESGRDALLPINPDPLTNISVSLKADKRTVRPGDELSLVAETDCDCFLTIMYAGSSGKAVVLWPNREFGWDGKVSAHVPVNVPGKAAGFKITADGTRPNETIVAYATDQSESIFNDHDFKELHEGRVKFFAGDAAALAEDFRQRVARVPRDEKWGTAHLVLHVLSSNGSEEPVGARDSTRLTIPFAIRSFSGKYLSTKDGVTSFTADTIGQTEIFRFQIEQNNRWGLVGYNRDPVTVQSSKGPETVEISYIYSGGLLGVGLRSALGRYMVADEVPGQGATFSACAPSPQTRKGFFTLIPVPDEVKGEQGPGNLQFMMPH